MSESEPSSERNREVSDDGFILRHCVNLPSLGDFDCGDADLNEYFTRDAVIARENLLSETYELVTREEEQMVSLVSICNDAIELKRIADRCDFPDGKGYRVWPAVKIARLGTRSGLQSLGGGTQVINMLKRMFIRENRTGCRIMTVDAYNNPRTLRFYEKNDFSFLTDKDSERATRAMFFDLQRLRL